MVLGTYREVLGARSTDKTIQRLSQDGGIVTSLLCFALDEKIIDGAVVAGSKDNNIWKPEPKVVLSSDEVLEAAGTKYTICPNLWSLKAAVRQYGLENVGTVTLPCQTMGLRKMQSYPFGVRFLADKVALDIGIFCTENFPFESLKTFINTKAGVNFDLVEKIDIGKGKFWIHTQDEMISFPIKETHGYEQSGCNVCLDLVSELSDLSTGSIGAPDGWSTVLLRTDTGENVFKMAVDAGVIKTKPIDELKPGIGLLEKLSWEKKDKNQKTIDDRLEMGLHVPYPSSSEKEDPLMFLGPVDYEDVEDKFKLYGFILYSSLDDDIAKFINERGSFLNAISREDCCIVVFENPEKWGNPWQNDVKEKLGVNFDNYIEEWKKLSPNDRDLSYKVAQRLNIPNKAFPLIIFMETLNSQDFKPLLIIENKDEYQEYFNDVFDIVNEILQKDSKDLLNDLEKGFKELEWKWIKPEKLKKRGKTLIRWSAAIQPIEQPFIDVITPILNKITGNI